jgi:hypothetical protein
MIRVLCIVAANLLGGAAILVSSCSRGVVFAAAPRFLQRRR